MVWSTNRDGKILSPWKTPLVISKLVEIFSLMDVCAENSVYSVQISWRQPGPKQRAQSTE